jgi:hypothetical protein
MKWGLGLFLLIQAQLTQAYVPSLTTTGKKIKWADSRSSLDLQLVTNSSRISSVTTEAIVEDSVSRWRPYSPFPLYVTPVNNAFLGSFDPTISFSNSFNSFGSGVVALTSISYSESTGLINSADIFINESFASPVNMTTTPSASGGDDAYLGDIVTHELGHLFGLSHSEVAGSTMFFSIFKDQYTPSLEDQHALESHYSDGGGRVISGRIIGGDNVSIFGAKVQLYSVTQNKIKASVISAENGSFRFSNLESDRYLIIVNKLKNITSLPEKFGNVKNDFCPDKFVLSVFSKCGGRNKGRAQIFDLENDNWIDVGDISISCDVNVNKEYLASKLEEDFSFTADYFDGENLVHGSLLGVFFDNEIENAYTNSDYDSFKIDLTNLNASLGGYSLKINVLSDAFYNNSSLTLSYRREDQASFTVYTPSTNAIGLIENDRSISLPLSTNSSDNVFYFKVMPQYYDDDSIEEKFARKSIYTTFKEAEQVYLISYELFFSGSQIEPINFKPYEDNQFCTDAIRSYSIQKANPDSLQLTNASALNTAGCGTIGKPDGSNFFTVVLSAFMLLGLYVNFRRRLI